MTACPATSASTRSTLHPLPLLEEMARRWISMGTVAALDRNPAVHTVKAVDPVHALKLSAQDFDDILSLDFELVQAVFRALCRMIREAQLTPR